MDIEKLFETWSTIMKAFQSIEEAEMQKPLLCMVIDMVAVNCGMESVALLDSLRPHIEEVNATMGQFC